MVINAFTMRIIRIFEKSKKMNSSKLDIFKICLIILLAGFLYTYYQSAQIGRFELHGDKVLDTKTGWTRDIGN